jgi:hypothetical protein
MSEWFRGHTPNLDLSKVPVGVTAQTLKERVLDTCATAKEAIWARETAAISKANEAAATSNVPASGAIFNGQINARHFVTGNWAPGGIYNFR